MIKEIIQCLDGNKPEILRGQLHENLHIIVELLLETLEEYSEVFEGMWSRKY